MNEDAQRKEEEVQFQETDQQQVGEATEQANESMLPPDIPPMPSSTPMIVVLGLIAMLSGLLVVLVYEYTAPIIAEKERLALEAAVFRVIPGVDTETAKRVSFSLTEEKGLQILDEQSSDKANLYAVYDSSGSLSGFAMEGAAQGYQDVVRALFGYSLECECIFGMTILKSTDTPGLGDKATVEKNKKFMANFDKLDVKLAEDKNSIVNPIKTVKHGTKTESWQVDAMSGATITSRAIAKGMADTTGRLLPLLTKHLVEIRSAAGDGGQ